MIVLNGAVLRAPPARFLHGAGASRLPLGGIRGHLKLPNYRLKQWHSGLAPFGGIGLLSLSRRPLHFLLRLSVAKHREQTRSTDNITCKSWKNSPKHSSGP